ncbi:Tn3 family transposase [Streptomyces sp. NPDC058469]|uniref:Tn3 family transposase n=1 Tax=Streptomyces sp. NPDC058469 TaxID=3346514 RepID=UPI00365AACE4
MVRAPTQKQGVLPHCTDVEIDRQYADTHGASIVGFAFAHMLGFNLVPRLATAAFPGSTEASPSGPDL